MESSASNPGSNARRLDSWKAIARYLNCDVRTARRWEAQERLPVQRHLHNSKATVFAWREEIDDWMASRITQAPDPGHSIPIAALAGVGAFTLSAVLMGFFSWQNTSNSTVGQSPDPPPVHAISLSVVQVSDETGLVGSPRISEGQITWHRWDGNDDEIMLHADGVNRQITDNEVADLNPDISAGRIVWLQGKDCNSVVSGLAYDCDVFLYDRFGVHRLTRDEIADGPPRISERTIVWHRFDGHDYEIVSHDGSALIPLTDNELDDIDPDVDGISVIWAGNDGHDYEIYLYDGVTTTQLTDNDVPDRKPAISGSMAAWVRGNRLIFWQAGKEMEIPQTGKFDWAPSISGDLIVWNRNQDIYVYDGEAAIRLTDGRVRNWWPDIDGNEIVWLDWVGDQHRVMKAHYLGTRSVVSKL